MTKYKKKLGLHLMPQDFPYINIKDMPFWFGLFPPLLASLLSFSIWSRLSSHIFSLVVSQISSIQRLWILREQRVEIEKVGQWIFVSYKDSYFFLQENFRSRSVIGNTSIPWIIFLCYVNLVVVGNTKVQTYLPNLCPSHLSYHE